MKKNYAFIVMMNQNPMGGSPDWEPFKVFMSRKDAAACVKELWKSEWFGYPPDEVPIDKEDWLDIAKVELGNKTS